MPTLNNNLHGLVLLRYPAYLPFYFRSQPMPALSNDSHGLVPLHPPQAHLLQPRPPSPQRSCRPPHYSCQTTPSTHPTWRAASSSHVLPALPRVAAAQAPMTWTARTDGPARTRSNFRTHRTRAIPEGTTLHAAYEHFMTVELQQAPKAYRDMLCMILDNVQADHGSKRRRTEGRYTIPASTARSLHHPAASRAAAPRKLCTDSSVRP